MRFFVALIIAFFVPVLIFSVIRTPCSGAQQHDKNQEVHGTDRGQGHGVRMTFSINSAEYCFFVIFLRCADLFV